MATTAKTVTKAGAKKVSTAKKTHIAIKQGADGRKRFTGSLGSKSTVLTTPQESKTNASKVKIETIKTVVKTTTYRFNDDRPDVKLKPEFESQAKEINNTYVKMLKNEEKVNEIFYKINHNIPSMTAEENKIIDNEIDAKNRLELVNNSLSDKPYTVTLPRVKVYPNYLQYLTYHLANEKKERNYRFDFSIEENLKKEITEVKKIKKIGEPALVEAQENYDRLTPLAEKIREKYAPTNASWVKSLRDAIDASDKVKEYRKKHYDDA